MWLNGKKSPTKTIEDAYRASTEALHYAKKNAQIHEICWDYMLGCTEERSYIRPSSQGIINR